MKQFISFIRKEFFHIFRDRRTMLILLGMPIVQIILFGFAITTEVKNVRVAVLDPSNDVVTRRIIDRMDASEYFTVIRRLHFPADMEASFGRGEIDMALVFSPEDEAVRIRREDDDPLPEKGLAYLRPGRQGDG